MSTALKADHSTPKSNLQLKIASGRVHSVNQTHVNVCKCNDGVLIGNNGSLTTFEICPFCNMDKAMELFLKSLE